ncbi:phosphatase PAP2 family protein [Pajaroellobacter abortibovis]|uniref:Inositolphosphotransferase Aur1/Ipt1 domain-containing protein n=1 Tax=Pajaroellobacter abortibovis TaxID=1882918 RepID=A0A1L6MXS3_9BACT|nr:phosphatase PAP2 family protein [Pajaroellobacter abortibovis]APS00287.1 hypothetical protein BCY86_06020 [Pajaroellobacter abortibovis]
MSHPYLDPSPSLPSVTARTLTTSPSSLTPPLSLSGWILRFLYNMAFQDWLITCYLSILLIASILGTGSHRAVSIRHAALDLVSLWLGLIFIRGLSGQKGRSHALIYRLLIFGVVFLSYFQLRDILPTVTSHAADGDIFALDMKLFHMEPTLLWDRFITPSTTEWFAFFYFSHFLLLATHILPFVFVSNRTSLLTHFSLGVCLVFCIGHVLYLVVPGYGPYRYLADYFTHPLEGGLFWKLVQSAVSTGGAQKDIFPSVHTAAPLFFTLFSFQYRHLHPFKYTWLIVAFFTTQIIIATMFLRWHYLIDILAGILLATISNALAKWISQWEEKRRKHLGLQSVFIPLHGLPLPLHQPSLSATHE